MRLQEITIEKSEYSEMYFRGGVIVENAIHLKKGESVSFDTYFNSLDYPKYLEYTKVKTVTVSLDIEGEGELCLCTFDGKEERVVRRATSSGAVAELSATLDGLAENGILYPVFFAHTDTVIKGGGYFCENEADTVSCAIVICTFHREECVYKNLKLLSEERIKGIDRIYVIDNGQTLDKSGIDTDYIKILPNKNYGGSGGFTRGIIEAYEAEDISLTHVILMDDDVVIYKNALEKIIAFLSLRKEEAKNAHISASMLPLSCIAKQFEAGAKWNGSCIESFKQGLDLRQRESLIKNLEKDDVQYGAWWCFCIPLNTVRRWGLPLPMFIKFDDVEYGTRCCQDSPIITLNGVCVAHEDFDRKYSMHLEYYNIRNQLIMLACHNRQNRFGCISRLAKVSARHLFLYRYEEMDVVLRAFEDFLKGADFLMSQDWEELNREIMSQAPKSKNLSEINGWRNEMREGYSHKKRSLVSKAVQVLTLGGHIIPSCFLKREIGAFPLPDAKVGSSYLRKKTIQYQLGSDTGYEFNRHTGKFLKYFFKSISMAVKILFLYPRAKRSYNDSFMKLTSFDFWKEKLGKTHCVLQ